MGLRLVYRGKGSGEGLDLQQVVALVAIVELAKVHGPQCFEASLGFLANADDRLGRAPRVLGVHRSKPVDVPDACLKGPELDLLLNCELGDKAGVLLGHVVIRSGCTLG